MQSVLPPGDYRIRAVITLQLERELRMAMFYGPGLYRLGVHQDQVINTPGADYSQTRKWAAAAYDAGFDGVIWMSHQLNNTKTWMVFGDRVPEAAVTVTDAIALGGAGFDWLVDTCAPLKVDVFSPFSP